MSELERYIQDTLTYFAHFKYSPTFDEIHIFLGKKVAKKILEKELLLMKKQGKLTKIDDRYTMGEYSKEIVRTVQRYKFTQSKIALTKRYIYIISLLPVVKLVGFSGSVAMNNADLPDDIDLFIVTEKNRMWITRLTCLVFAQLLGLRRKRGQLEASNKVCLNLFFDERDLVVPQHKKTTFIAHEILQMKPVFSRKNTYEIFLTANSWIFTIFPNAKNRRIISYRTSTNTIKNTFLTFSFLGDIVEQAVKHLQMKIIEKHRTKELITHTQLWFFPRDYEEILPKSINLKRKSPSRR